MRARAGRALRRSCYASPSRPRAHVRAPTHMRLRSFLAVVLLQAAQLRPLGGLQSAAQQPATFPKRAVYPQSDPEVCVVLISKPTSSTRPPP